jgi:type I restriction enzyme S subunit
MDKDILLKIELPKGWAKATISEMISADGVFVDGDWIESKDQDPNGEVRLIQLADIGDGDFRNKSSRFLTLKRANEIGCTFLLEGDILVARMPDPIGRACLFPLKGENKFVTAVDVAIIRTGKDSINNKLLNYFINSPIIRNKIEALQSGTTRKRISRGNLSLIEFPVPPLNEQNRIVDKLDELISELEKGKEQLQTSLEQLKVYRQSILKHAFEGKLTNENTIEGELPEGWKYKSIEEISSVLGDGLHGTPKYTDSGDYYFINGNNLSDGIIEIKPNTKRVSKSEFEKYKKPLNENTVFVSINGSIGYTAFYNNEKVILGKSACYFNVIEGVSKYYVRYYIKSNDFIVYANKEATGSTIKNLGLRAMRDFKIPFPPTIEEQNKIVQEIEKQFSICQNLEETLLSHIEIAEGLKKSILIKAFEGKLVEQDPIDEHANVLLERIKKEREEFLIAEKERKKTEKPLHIKARKMAEELKRIIEILKESKEPVSAKTLWQSSTHKDDIDDFYAALKKHIEAGEIIELPRKGKESYLKLADAK